MTTRFRDGVGAFARDFDAFVVDQWGVLHNGTEPYPGVLECLDRLKALGKPVVILSNSGKRAAANRDRLAALGLTPEHYTTLVTSGEAAWTALRDRSDPFYARLGRHCLLLSRGADASAIEGLGLERVGAAEAADFLIVSSTNEPDFTVDAYEALLRTAAARHLPMICSNPDLVGVTATGLVPSPGMLARRYEELGGQVRYIGKPHPEIYRFCLRTLGAPAPDRVIAVGDSLQHDVAGGAGAGLVTALVAGGIHADRFSDPAGAVAALAELSAEHAATPDFVIPQFRW